MTNLKGKVVLYDITLILLISIITLNFLLFLYSMIEFEVTTLLQIITAINTLMSVGSFFAIQDLLNKSRVYRKAKEKSNLLNRLRKLFFG